VSKYTIETVLLKLLRLVFVVLTGR